MSVRTEQIESYNPVFDYVRATASLVVFVCHLLYLLVIREINFDAHRLLVLETLAAVAVEFFFALSGILLGRVLYQQFSSPHKKKNVRIFIYRRWLRTLPVYYLGLFLYFAMYAQAETPPPDNWPAYLVFLQSPISFNNFFFGVSWSLCIEEIFYLLFPLLVIGFLRLGIQTKRSFIAASIIIVLACFTARQIYLPYFESGLFDLRTGFIFRLDSIVAGLIIGIFLRRISGRWAMLSLAFVLLSAALWMVFGVLFTPEVLLHQIIIQVSLTLLPWACALIILYLSCKTILSAGKVPMFFADISYALYVLHMPLIYILYQSGIDNALMPSVYIAFVLCASWLVFKYLETPILRLRPVYKK